MRHDFTETVFRNHSDSGGDEVTCQTCPFEHNTRCRSKLLKVFHQRTCHGDSSDGWKHRDECRAWSTPYQWHRATWHRYANWRLMPPQCPRVAENPDVCWEVPTVFRKDLRNSRPRAFSTTLIQSINDHHDISSRGTFQLGKGFDNELLPLCYDVCRVPQ